MISAKKFNEGMKWLKENYNLKDFSPVTTRVWFEILKDEPISDHQFERCVRIIIKTIPNWYQAGESLASRVLAVLPQAREELRTERSRLEATTKPKELDMSDKERRENVERLGKMLRASRDKLSLPPLQGESRSDRRERVQREVEAEFK